MRNVSDKAISKLKESARFSADRLPLKEKRQITFATVEQIDAAHARAVEVFDKTFERLAK